MPSPEPRRDESGVPWCSPDCSHYRVGRNTFHVTCTHPERAHASVADAVCLPALQADHAELVTLRAKGAANG
jgi:hypothetical protein